MAHSNDYGQGRMPYPGMEDEERQVLYNLPDELLMLIFYELSCSDLYNVMHTAHRFFYVGLPSYLVQRGLDISSTGTALISTLTHTLDLLPLLEKATFISSLDHLSIELPYPDDHLHQHVLTTCQILNRMKVLNRFTLILSRKANWNQRVGNSTRENKEMIALRDSVVAMLNAAARVSRTLAVCQGSGANLLIGGRTQVLTQASLSAGSRKLRGVWLDKILGRLPFSRIGRGSATGSSKDSHFLQDTAHINNLCSLVIRSSLLVTPPLILWTVDIINSSSLTHLFIDLRCVDEKDWGIILSALYIPTLEKFTYRATFGHISFDDLTIFVLRHPRIHTLDLGVIERIPEQYLGNSVSGVTTLTALPRNLESLLSLQNLFPNLQTIYIQWDDITHGTIDVPNFDSSVAPVLRHRSNKTIGLRIYHQLSYISVNLDHALSVNLDHARASSVMPCITILKIVMGRAFVPKSVTPLRDCVGMFPNLTHLSIDDAPDRIVRKLEMDKSDLKYLIAKTLCQASPGLKKLEIYGDTDTFENWVGRSS